MKKIISLFVCFGLILLNINFAAAAAEPLGNSGSICGGYEIKKSLIVSVLTMCIPGILEKVNEYKNILCEEATCYYDSIMDQLDPSFCKSLSDHKVCSYVVGDIFALPGLHLIDQIKSEISDALAQPGGFILGVITEIGRDIVKANCVPASAPSGGSCDSTTAAISIALVINDLAGIWDQLTAMQDNFPSTGDSGACGRLDSIRTEMDDIINSNTI